MKVTLKDGSPRSTGSVQINVSKNGNTLEIGAAGVEPAPLTLEYYDGKLTVRVYAEPAIDSPTYKSPLPVAAKPAPAEPTDAD